MKIYFLDKNAKVVQELKNCFKDCDNVEIVQSDFKDFMNVYDVECVASSGNSFGIMTGGYDLAIVQFFGEDIMKTVQTYIKKHYNGQQPVGTAFCINILNHSKKLIHSPSMVIPSKIKDENVVYSCVLQTLLLAKNNNIKSVVIPAFGCGCGRIDFKIAAKLMRKAFDDYNNKSY